MKRLLPVKTVLCAALCFAMMDTPAFAKTLYRWVDEHGKVSFSDQVPPTQASLGHEVLDKNANVVGVAAKAKTKAEFDMEKRLNQLRKQQEQAIKMQKAQDKQLLSSFINLAALDATKKSKIQAFAEQEREIRDTLKKLTDELAAKHKEAAAFEIKNAKVPKEILDQIEDNQQKTIKANQDIKDLHVKIVATEKEFAADRERYLFLTQAQNNSAAVKPATPANQPGLVGCDNPAQCEKAWAAAKEFVKSNSTAKITIDTETLFMSADPVVDTDLSVSVSKMLTEGKQTEVFLDIRCADTIAGKTVCASPKADEIRVRFNDYIKAKLKTATAAPAPAPAKK